MALLLEEFVFSYLCFSLHARPAFQSSECDRRPAASATLPATPLIDLSTSGLWMTSALDVATLPETSASGVDSQLPTNTCSSRSRDRTPVLTTKKKSSAGRKRKQVCGKTRAVNPTIIIFYEI